MKAIPSADGSIEASGEMFELVDGEANDSSESLIRGDENANGPNARATSFDFLAVLAREDPSAEVIPIEGETDIETALSMEAMAEMMQIGAEL